MSGPRFRAWKFQLPSFSAPGGPRGLEVSPTGGIAMVEEDDAIRQSIQMLLSTAPGERVMRPQYGCDLRRLVFAPNDDTTAGLAIHYVEQAVRRWEPRIDILRVDATRDEDPGRLNIVLEYRIRSTQRAGQTTVPLRLTGETA